MNDPRYDDRLDDWLDGRLPPARAAAFERRTVEDPALATDAAAQRSVDAFLRRRFTPDAGLAERVLARLELESPARAIAAARSDSESRTRTMWLAAAAALLVGLSLGLLALQKRTKETSSGATGAQEGVAGALVAPKSGPRERNPRLPGETALARTIPDFDAMFAFFERAVPSLDPTSGAAEPSSGSSSEPSKLQNALASRYGECFDVGPAGCELEGPYNSPDLASATIFLAYCDGEVEPSSMLVFDDQTMQGCGLTPHARDLQPFYKEVNGLAVWEITPEGSPQVLDSIRSCSAPR